MVLFFGCRSKAYDYIYQTDMEAALAEKVQGYGYVRVRDQGKGTGKG